jgi:hypothetical protein
MSLVERLTDWLGRTGGAVRAVLRKPRLIATILVACLVGGFILTIIATVPEYTFRETRHHEGVVDPFTVGRNAAVVPDAAYDGMGFADATTPALDCAVSIVFLTDAERQAFEQGADLPPPQLHCQRTAARLPGAIVAAYVENQGANASSWSIDLDFFAVSHPRAVYGLPAIALFLVSALGVPILLLERVLPKWMESIRPKDEDPQEPRRRY